MFWQEETKAEDFTAPDRVVDLLFSIDCPTLPVDHAWALFQAIQAQLEWFDGDPRCGLHLIHGAETGNGWERPSGEHDLLNLSRRTKLKLRVPQERIEQANQLCNTELDIAGHPLVVKTSKSQPLAKTNILYARYVAQPDNWDEEQFIEWAVEQLQGEGLKFKKLLCGKTHQIHTDDATVFSRSLMVGDMPFEDAMKLQEIGLGPMRSMGCGIFIPQKSF